MSADNEMSDSDRIVQTTDSVRGTYYYLKESNSDTHKVFWGQKSRIFHSKNH